MKYSTVSFASTSRRRTTAPTETTLVSTRFLSMTLGVREALLELRDAVLEHHLLVLRVVVLGVLRDLAELARSRDALRDLPAPRGPQHVELARQLLVALGSEDHILHKTPPETRLRGRPAPTTAGMVATPFEERQTSREYDPELVIDLREPWRIGPVEVPTRLVLAPMAGVSVQAFRRQGRRYGAGLVCSEMVSCAGIEHRNEKTLGYLRVASDEHPLAIQLFGSEPRPMADAARMVEAVGADIVDVNFGCPVKKVTKTGAGAHLLEDQDRACRIIEAIADAVDVPVTVKLRRGVQNGSRAALELGPRLVEAGASSLTLHPRSAQQMYTGTADHALTAELVSLVDVPVVASGDVTSRARAQTVLATTGAEAVMVGRGAQGNPWALREIVDGDAKRAHARGGRSRARALRPRDGARAGRAPRVGVPQEVLRLVPRSRSLSEGVQAGARSSSTRREEVERRLLAAAPGAFEIVERLEAEVPSGAELTLELPVSIYGGG